MEQNEMDNEVHNQNYNPFTEVEEILNLKIPEQLKNMLIVNGYDNINSLAELTDNDIVAIENFARSILPDLLSSQEEREKYYGIFSKKVEAYTIVSGYRKLLNSISKYFKQKSSESFKRMSHLGNKNLPSSTPGSCCSTSTATTSKRVIKPVTQPVINLTLENSHISSALKKWIKKKTDADASGDQWQYFNQKFNDIHIAAINDGDKLSCTITCFCTSKITLIKVAKSPTQAARWIYSNFETHFLKKHINTYNRTIPVKKAQDKAKLEVKLITDYMRKNEKNEENNNVTVLPQEKRTYNIAEELDEKYLEGSSNENPYETLSKKLKISPQRKTGNEISIYDAKNTLCSPTINIVDDIVLREATVTEKKSSRWKSDKYQRKERTRRQREKEIASGQTFITEFYPILERINDDPVLQKCFMERILHFHYIEDPEEDSTEPYTREDSSDKTYTDITEEITVKTNDSSQITSKSPEKKITHFLKLLIDISNKNSQHSNNKNTYEESLKKFAVYLYYIGGRLLYETLQSNLKNTLPAISTLNRYVDSQGVKTEEGHFDFAGLNKFLEERKLCKYIWLSEDATRITGKIEYDRKTNEIIGFTLPLKDGLPERHVFCATSTETIQRYFLENSKANYAYVIMAQPLSSVSPAYCLGLFGTDNKFIYKDVISRWNYFKEIAKSYDITIMGISSDGDTRLLKAMRVKSNFPHQNEPSKASSKEIACVKIWPWFQMNLEEEKLCFFQDPVHILTKLRTRILKPGIELPMGKFLASADHLQTLIDNFPKDLHMLTLSDIKPEDKMNFRAAEKICDLKVIELLDDKVPGSAGTRSYLKVMNLILAAFLDISIDIETRLYNMWYAVFFLRIWRSWIKNHKSYSLKSNFLSDNCYLCIEINAHNLIKLIKAFQENDELSPEMFLPWMFGSQTCEKIFRATRSLTSTFSTVVNFSLKDILSRMDRIKSINNILNDLKDTFVFPREQARNLRECTSREHLLKCNINISDVEITKIVENALKDSITDTKKLEMVVDSKILNFVTVGKISKNNNEAIEKNESEILEEDSKEIRLIENELDEDENNIDNTLIQNAADKSFIVGINNQEDHDLLYENVSTSIQKHAKKGLHLKDFSHKIKEHGEEFSEKCPYVKIEVSKDEFRIVKKSSFCWLLDQSQGKVSTDRLRRFFQPKSDNKPNSKLKRKKNIEKNTKSKPVKTETEESSEESNEDEERLKTEMKFDDWDTESVSSISDIESNMEQKTSEEFNVILEQYYAVYYEERWYIGRIIEKCENKFKINFLFEQLGQYLWPKKEDIAWVEKQFIFHGPIRLMGSGPFQLKRTDKINIDTKYKSEKCKEKSFLR